MRTEAQVNKTNRSDNFNKHHIVSVKAVSCHQQSQVFLEVKHILLLSSSSLLLLCIVWFVFLSAMFSASISVFLLAFKPVHNIVWFVSFNNTKKTFEFEFYHILTNKQP